MRKFLDRITGKEKLRSELQSLESFNKKLEDQLVRMGALVRALRDVNADLDQKLIDATRGGQHVRAGND